MRLSVALLATLLLLASITAPTDAQQRLRQLMAQRRAASDAAPMPPGTRVERDIAYGSHAQQRYDLYLPADMKRGAPILVMVHGGGWRNGDKGNPGVAGDKAAHWLAKGFVFVNVNNRLLPDADPLQQAGDVAAAVSAAQKRAASAGADAHRTFLMGHSAGAHLVALLGAAPDRLAKAGANRPLGVVPLDSAAMNVPQLMDRPRLPQLYHDAFGRNPAFWVDASPFHQLTRRGLPMLIVCSSRRPDSCPQGRALTAKAASFGLPMEVLPEDLSHGEINHELGKASAYTQAVTDWIDAQLP